MLLRRHSPLLLSGIAMLLALPLQAGSSTDEWKPSAQWPSLASYDEAHLYRIALPLGGIGTGTVSLGGRGELRDWEIMNIPGKGFTTCKQGNGVPFFAVYCRPEGGKADTRMLAGKGYGYEYMSCEGIPFDNYGLPRFGHASFEAAYPFGQVHLSDDDLPLEVTIKGFNPLVPPDAEASGLPVAILSYEITNTGDCPAEVAVCGSMRNFIGKDGSKYSLDWNDLMDFHGAKDNENAFRDNGGLRGIYFFSNGVPEDSPAWGTMALTTQATEGISYRTAGRPNSWNTTILDFWDDFSDDGVLVERYQRRDNDPMASLCVKKTVGAGQTETFTFFLTWNFPNRFAWSDTKVGNWYSERYADAWDAAEKIVPRIPELEKKTIHFVETFLSASYPDYVKEAALYNISTLRSQTVFRLPSGQLMGWEGTKERVGSCAGSCTHVWNYEVTTPFLFGELARSMRDIEFGHSTFEDGHMNFRSTLPLDNMSRGGAAADGQMGTIMKAYREWQLSGDKGFLEKYWPKIKLALGYAWVEKGWDGNQDGVMEGSQHNTMDVNYFGPNPQMQFWYMGALRAAEEMAIAMKDKAFARKCRTLFENGSRWMDSNLFNGEYYEHRITDPETFEFLDMDDPDVKVPEFQLGPGCLVDQLVGQYMAHVCGLGYLADEEKVKATYRSIMKYNWRDDFDDYFNNMRAYVLYDEQGLVMGSWPKGRLKIPFPYWAEAMTGFEYAAAIGMLYEGMEADGLKCIEAVRDRFDGLKRNPFDEIECGHHYARAMTAYGAILALSGFHYSGVDRSVSFTSRPGRYFWANGESWGTCEVTPEMVTVSVESGCLDVDSLTLSGRTKPVAKKVKVSEGEQAGFRL